MVFRHKDPRRHAPGFRPNPFGGGLDYQWPRPHHSSGDAGWGQGSVLGRRWLLGHRKETRDGQQDSGVQSGDKARQTPYFAKYTGWPFARSDRDRQGPHPRKGRAPIPGGQAPVRIPENQSAWLGQESPQNRCAGTLDQSVDGTRKAYHDSLRTKWHTLTL